MRIDLLEHSDEILKPGIHLFEIPRLQGMGLGPMGSSTVLEHDLFEGSE